MKIRKIISVIFILLLIFLQGCNSNKFSSVWDGSKLIGHAFGSIDGFTYTNSLEAFYAAYNRGIRTFEVDFLMTSDDKVVLAHDWTTLYGSEIVPTEEYFLNTKIFDKYTPLSFLDLLKLVRKYPDIWIITDTKQIEIDMIKKQFTEMVNVAKENNLEYILNHFIVQIYYEEMYEVVKNVYPFKNIVFTLYNRWNGDINSFNSICAWSSYRGIDSIIMHTSLFNQRIYQIAKQYNLNIYLHTENNISIGNYFLSQGVSGIYTDDIAVDNLIKIKTDI